MKDNVVSLRDRLEKWSEVYTTPTEDLSVHTSTHGRIKFSLGDKDVVLSFVEGVQFLSQTSIGIETAMSNT